MFMRKIASILIIVFWCSCQNKEETQKIENEKKEQQISVDNEIVFKNLAVKYKADTVLNFKYTYELQDMYADIIPIRIQFSKYSTDVNKPEKKPICFMGEIKDIVKEDSVYIIEISIDRDNIHYTSDAFETGFYASLITKYSDFIELKKQLVSNEDTDKSMLFVPSKKISFVMHVTRVRSGIIPKEDNYSDENGTSSKHDYENPYFVFIGNMVDYHINK
jgi:hypothetical protein